MHVKGRFGTSCDTNNLVAVTEDTFDDDIIANELKMLEQSKNIEDEEEMKFPGISNHFLVFVADTWSPKGKIQFLATQYGLPSTITATQLTEKIEKIMLIFAFYEFPEDLPPADFIYL